MPSDEIRLAILSPEQARDALARIAEREIGVREIGGNNRGPRVREYQSATWTEPGVWPWCAAFVCWCVKLWIESPSVKAVVHFHRPKTTGAFDFIRWAKDEGLQVLGENEPCRRGDIVVFDFSHIGVVTADSERGEIEVCEGNTNGRGERDSESGDGVWRKFRQRSLVRAFIRLV